MVVFLFDGWWKKNTNRGAKIHLIGKNALLKNLSGKNWIYMHNNPCKGKWNLAPSPVDYPHSSARFYISGGHSKYEVTNCAELFDIDLTKKLF
jgi:hypothetical protein